MSENQKPLALRCRSISKRFGSVVANGAIDFDIRAGEIHGLVGENGAGKSTLMNILYGVFPPDSGTIEVAGKLTRFSSCADAMRAGIGMVFQHYLLVERFSVAENVLLGQEPNVGGFLDKRASIDAVARTTAKYNFSLDPLARVETLGVGARQEVELLKVLERDPQIIILDEPTSALSPGEIEGLFKIIASLRSEGRAVIFITHKLKEVLRLCDRITVLRRGRVIATVDRADASETTLASMMVGTQGFEQNPAPPKPSSDRVRLALRGLEVSGDGGCGVQGIDFDCNAGEIVGIAGVEGNGQLGFAEALYGIRKIKAGSILLDGQDISRDSLSQRRAHGLRYVSPDRQREGLILDFDTPENVLLGDQRKTVPRFLLNRRAGLARAFEIAQNFNIENFQPGLDMRRYSGGTQQKVLVGREVNSDAKVIIAFAPTRGVDFNAARSIYSQLKEMQSRGAAIVLISYDLDEIRELCGRVVVFFNGAIAGHLSIDQADDKTLGKLMGGAAA